LSDTENLGVDDGPPASDFNTPSSRTARKRAQRSQRPAASELKELEHEVFGKAASLYRCKISTICPFPDTVQANVFAEDAWSEAIRGYGFPALPMTPKIRHLVSSISFLSKDVLISPFAAKGSRCSVAW
jgi:hypothetical protein